MRTLLLLAVVVTLLVTKQRADHLSASVSSMNTAAAAGSFLPEVPLDVTADEIQDAYSANEVAADRRYKNQLLNVSGAVQAIKGSVDNGPHLVLRSAGEPEGVRAMFTGEAGKVLAGVAKGDAVVVRCRGAGTSGGPIVHTCTLLENHRSGADLRAWPSEGTDDHVKLWSWE